ncbi:ABC transporter substrate-binding protein [Tardiphaga sp. 367_B4_N1_1]|uniref:ABC transporter substrate-binding protein n=1 Tax=Tardiphaga sp. 367_B4_N1_1 TaxID=3240777 RepID=UPI003F282F21
MRRKISTIAATLSLLATVSAASAADPVRIGVLTDLSGPLSDVQGPGSVEAAKIAVEEFGGTVLGRKIEIVSGDHQNKADVGLSMARSWIDVQKVGLIMDLGNSAVAIGVQNLVKDKNQISIATGAASGDLSNKFCNSNSFQWAYDTYQYAKVASTDLVKGGADTWFFITPDYAFGHALEADTRKAVEASGGKVIGGVKHPINNMDYSSFLLQAQASNAKVIAIASAVSDLQNVMKQGAEFNIFTDKQRPAALGILLADVHAIGLAAAQNTILSTVFYWDENDSTRRFAKKFQDRMKRPPSEAQAANYSATLHYLKAVSRANSTDTDKVLAKMRELPVEDDVTRSAMIREDGRLLRDVLLVQVKTPVESKGPWDYYKILRRIAGVEAFRPAAESVCPLLKK